MQQFHVFGVNLQSLGGGPGSNYQQMFHLNLLTHTRRVLPFSDRNRDITESRNIEGLAYKTSLHSLT